ncbi:hypothetical protein CFC21_011386 [Triticum aestivum]|uniref:Uncharacterized protein n=2 Tax=Triticum aestivum TaxID=4565 RepID=A0A3B5ZSQ1_WHEAT|nr:hypothetical protein CFC21_011386 [Triticum aestivum]
MDSGNDGNDNGGGGILEGYRLWMGASVAAAFFISMERFSCIHIHTVDDEDDYDPEEAKDRPLMLSRPQALPEYYYDRSGCSASFTKM